MTTINSAPSANPKWCCAQRKRALGLAHNSGAANATHNAASACRWVELVPRACLKSGMGAAARDFGYGRGGEVRASPQRAVRTEPTKPIGKRPAARRVFAPQAGWLRSASVEDP